MPAAYTFPTAAFSKPVSTSALPAQPFGGTVLLPDWLPSHLFAVRSLLLIPTVLFGLLTEVGGPLAHFGRRCRPLTLLVSYLLHDLLREFSLAFRGEVDWIRAPQSGQLFLVHAVLQSNGATRAHHLVVQDFFFT